MLDGHFIDPADAEVIDGVIVTRKYHSDIIMIYCSVCQERVDVPVSHEGASGTHYQAVNLPPHMAQVVSLIPNWTTTCESCNTPLAIETTITKPISVELTVKRDCSGMGLGMASWYDEHGPTA
jgi:hypothetical protein|tara:strand:+ start:5696 stop:6064 length:369 start_codon:yes stop_codon:yes gene_type:complete